MPKINSLYGLIKQKSQELGRPLKVITDWDECLQSFNAFVLYNSVKENESRNFADYFRDFSENKEVDMDFSESVYFAKYKGEFKDERLKNLQKQPNGTEKIKQEFQRFKEGDNFYENLPFLSIAKDLLLALKEGLISELIIVSASNGIRKKTKFDKTFGLFPDVKLSIHKTNKQYQQSLEKKRHRWEWIEEEHPDFDIFIDDNPWVMKEVEKIFSNQSEKVLVMPDYKCKHHHVEKVISKKPEKEYDVPDCINVYLIKNAVSDLKDEDFAQAAQEYKQKHPELASRQAHQAEESIWKQPYLYLALGIGVVLLGVGVYWILNKENKKSSNKK